jgi:tryptophan synthase beta chain
MGKTRVIAETGAGQHGVATAPPARCSDLECVVYMGTEDIRRQRPNVERMGCWARGRPGRGRRADAEGGGQRRDPRLGGQRRDDPLRDRLRVGPAPFPALVRDLQRVIGDEAREQALTRPGACPPA